MGFNAPRIIGGGQIQQPQQVDAMGDIADSTWKAAEMKQTQEEYDTGRMRVFVIKARDSKQKYTIRASIDYSTLKMEERSTEDDLEREIEEQLG